MNKIQIVSALVFASIAVACAAPTAEDMADQQKLASETSEKTGEVKEDLMKGGLGETCSVSCSSQDKLQTCCCGGINVKCVSYVASCECKTATLTSGSVFMAQ